MADDALNALAVSGQLPQEFLRPSGEGRDPADDGEDTHHNKVQPNTEPSEHVLQTWRTADCVCFDVGCEWDGHGVNTGCAESRHDEMHSSII